MSIVGFNYTKILAEKHKAPKGKVNVSNNVSIQNVEETQISVGENNPKALKFSFAFLSKYEPEVGHITLEGEVTSLEDDEKRQQILDKWQQEQKIDNRVMKGLVNHILQKCNIQALILSKDINLPPPIPVPKVQAKEQQGNNAAEQ